ncbi:glycosyltransferase [Thermosynechococcus sp. HY593]|uniref:glycosyltransferase n=1 Tax=Thermosynechococcus sp. HY593 TaxID=3074103 RepID=UPI0037DCC1AC
MTSYRPDVVVSFGDTHNVLMLAALLGVGIPVVVSERIDPRRHRVGRAWDAARRLLYPFAARVVVQTEAVAS